MRSGLVTLGILVSGLIAAMASCGGDDTTGGGGSGATTATGTATGTTTGTATGTTSNGGSGATGGEAQGGSGNVGNTGGNAQGGDGQGGGCTPTNPTMDSIGGDCTCEGSDCVNTGVPVPSGGGNGTIVGCDDVATDITGAELVCLKSYDGNLANKTYFANGYCSLQATQCDGDDIICNTAVWGDYAAMTSCPAGSVLVAATTEASVMGIYNATIDTKTCARGCSCGEDCRSTEADPVRPNDASRYECIDHEGVKFCYNPNSLSDTYTATQF